MVPLFSAGGAPSLPQPSKGREVAPCFSSSPSPPATQYSQSQSPLATKHPLGHHPLQPPSIPPVMVPSGHRAHPDHRPPQPPSVPPAMGPSGHQAPPSHRLGQGAGQGAGTRSSRHSPLRGALPGLAGMAGVGRGGRRAGVRHVPAPNWPSRPSRPWGSPAGAGGFPKRGWVPSLGAGCKAGRGMPHGWARLCGEHHAAGAGSGRRCRPTANPSAQGGTARVVLWGAASQESSLAR